MRLKLGRGFAEVVPENLDDLWTLSEVIRPGDRVEKRTARKVKLQLGDRTEADKKSMTLTLRVERVKFHEYRSSLRIHGEIVAGPEDVKGGHTFSVGPGSKLRIYKDFGSLELELLKEAESKQPDVAFVLVDRDGALVAHGGSRFRLSSGLESKRSDKEQDYSQFFGRIKARLEQIGPSYVVVAGPGFVKDRLAPELPYQTVMEGASSVSESGLREVMSRGALDKVGVRLREAEEQKALESVLSRVKSGRAFYGLEDARRAAEQGNVELMLVSSSKLSEAVRTGKYASLRETMEKVKYRGGKVMLVGRNGDAVAQLDGLGGVAGLRRWT